MSPGVWSVSPPTPPPMRPVYDLESRPSWSESWIPLSWNPLCLEGRAGSVLGPLGWPSPVVTSMLLRSAAPLRPGPTRGASLHSP